MIKVAINGFGRIGRLVFRIMANDPEFDIVAINDLTDAEQLAYLLKYDTNHRNYNVDGINFVDNNIVVDGKKIPVYSSMDPSVLPWGELGVDVVFECSGKFTDKDKASLHIKAGAKKVIISAPAKGDLKTIVYNVNDNILTGEEEVISAASCTTNCLAPVLKVINDEFGIEKGYMTTVHAYTNDQVILDVAHKKGIKARRGRAAAANIIPVPTGSVIDLTLELRKNVTVSDINDALKNNANETLGFTMDPIVSSDIIGSTHGGVVDGLLTNVLSVDGRELVKVVAWYDNEMSYSSQMVRTAKKLMQ